MKYLQVVIKDTINFEVSIIHSLFFWKERGEGQVTLKNVILRGQRVRINLDE